MSLAAVHMNGVPILQKLRAQRFQICWRGFCKCLREFAPQVGLEPATLRLTAGGLNLEYTVIQ